MKQYAHILNGASLAGLASFSMLLGFYYIFSWNPLGPIKLLAFVVPIVLYVFFLQKYRDETLEGIMPFKLAVTPGILFAFVYASLTTMLMYLLMTFLDDGILELNKLESLKQFGQTKEMMIEWLGKAKYEESIVEIENMGAATFASSDFFSKFSTSVIVNLIIAGILRKNPNSDTIDG